MEMPPSKIIVVGASSGGIEAMSEVARGLPREFPSAIFLVQHIAAHSANYLAEMLSRHTAIPTRTARDRDPIELGQIYVAPADHHLLIDADQMYLSQGPRENRMRPSVDPLFRSAALSHGPRVIGVILSGSLDDGTAGLIAVKQCGGVAVVQDPHDALTPGMPQSALDHVKVDHCVSAAELGPLLGRLAQSELTESGETHPMNSEQGRELLRHEVGIHRVESGSIDTALQLGQLVPASCPDCGGPLWEMYDEVPRFRCHTGHSYTARNLVAGLQEAEESALWVALRVMEERARMLRRLAKNEEKRDHRQSLKTFTHKAEEAEEHVLHLRRLLRSRDTSTESHPS